MTLAFAQPLLAWLLTYALHSTVLLMVAFVAVRSRRVSPSFADVIWKTALVGGILTATVQTVADRRPAGSFALATQTAVEGSFIPADAGAALDAAPSVAPRSGAPSSTAPLASGPTAASNPSAPTGTTSPAGAGDASSASHLAWTSMVALTWLFLAVAFVLWYAGRRLVLVGRLGDRRPVEAGELTHLLDTLCRESGISSYVHLTASGAISSPVALGSGEICLPSAALVELEPAQQRAMLAHELAHLVRRDPQWLAISCVVERAFFFQPLNRLARRGLQESAELCADEWAARHTGGVPLARALVKVAEWIQASPLGLPVAGFAEERSQLTRRVSRLLEAGALATPRPRVVAVSVAAATLLLTAAFAPGVAGTAQAIVAPSAQPGSSVEFARDEAKEKDRDPVAINDDEQRSRGSESNPNATAASTLANLTVQQEYARSNRELKGGEVVDTAIVRAVMARLKDEVPEVRQAAADALGRLRHAMAIPALVETLEDEEPEVRKAAMNALSNYERGVPAAPIRRMLDSDDEEMRYAAIEILSELRDRASIPRFLEMVSDPSEEVRHQVLHALNELEAPVSEEVLGKAMQDASADVRQTAAELAGDRQMTVMVPHLIRLIDDRSGDVREQAAHSLTEMRTEASHAALRKALTHTDSNVRRIAVEYFGSDRDR